MTLIEPMPQEIALAHAGRVKFLFPSGLSAFEPRTAHEVREPKLVTLAKACGMKPEDYACNHSLLPFWRMVTSADHQVPHGQLGQETLIRRLGTNMQGKFARICPHCVNDDLNHWHFTWYRRTHQLPGIDWCPVHLSPLLAVNSLDPWTVPPHHWAEQELIRPAQAASEEIFENGFLGRMVEIACELLERSASLPVGRIGAAFTERLQQMGFRVSQDGAKPVLSDIVREKAPSAWLKQHWTGLKEKRSGEIYSGLDRVVARTVPATGFAYVTALAAMFESASEALNFFTSAAQKDVSKPNPGSSRDKIRKDSFWIGELWPLYERSEGNIADLARHLDMDRTYLAEKLQRYCMPSLKDCQRDPRWLALLRFQAGTSLSAACRQENVDVELVEALLRRVNPRVIELARTIVQRCSPKSATRNAGVIEHVAHENANQCKHWGGKPETIRIFNPDQTGQSSSELAYSA